MRRQAVTQISVHAPVHPSPRVITSPSEPRFANAFNLLGLLSEISAVDRILGGLKSDSVVLITGSRIRLHAAEKYCVRTQLPKQMGGSGGSAFFIDGGNSFDVYFFTSAAREYGFDYHDSLDRVILSRAFTPYELKQLVCKDSEVVLRARGANLIVVSDIFSLFTEDFEKEEAFRIVQKMGASLSRLSERYHIPIVITSPSVPEHLKDFIPYCCNMYADFQEQEHSIRSQLLVHPTRLPFQARVEVGGQNYNQAHLVPFGAAEHG
jgi:hypothetical protein